MRQNFIVDDGSVVEYEDVFYCYCGDLDRMSILKLVGVLCSPRLTSESNILRNAFAIDASTPTRSNSTDL